MKCSIRFPDCPRITASLEKKLLEPIIREQRESSQMSIMASIALLIFASSPFA